MFLHKIYWLANKLLTGQKSVKSCYSLGEIGAIVLFLEHGLLYLLVFEN